MIFTFLVVLHMITNKIVTIRVDHSQATVYDTVNIDFMTALLVMLKVKNPLRQFKALLFALAT